MGCNSSQPPAPKKNSDASGTPFVKKAQHHSDVGLVMCPYFKVSPDAFDNWKKNCDAFYSAAQEAEDLISYSMAFNDGGVHIRQAYRNATALLTHLRTADKPMTDALQQSTLERVEVHGPRKAIAKVKKEMTKIGDCYFSFFVTPNKLKPFRRPTEFGGQGADKLICFDVSLEVQVDMVRSYSQRIKEIHRATRDNNGNESFSVSYCAQQSMLYFMGAFDSAESVVDHFFSIQKQLGEELWNKCKTHLSGPDSDVNKLKSLLDQAGDKAKKALAASMAAAGREVKAAKAYADHAAQWAEKGVSDAVKESRDAMKATIEALQDKAEELAKQVFKKAMEAEGAVREEAKATAKAAYKRAMAAAHELRQEADEAAVAAYEKAMSAGAAIEEAMTQAKAAAQAAAESMHEDVKESAEAAEAALKEAVDALKGAASDAKAALQEQLSKAEKEAEAAKLALQVNVQALEHALGEAAIKSREAVMGMWDDIKSSAVKLVDSVLHKQVETKEITVEYVEMVKVRARSAAWTVVIAKQQVFLVTYETQISMRKAAEDAVVAAKEAADAAADKALALFKSAEQLASDAVKMAEAMLSRAAKSVELFWSSTTTYVVDTEKAMRYTLHKAAATVMEDVHEAAFEITYYVHTVIEDMESEAEEMHNSIQARIESWWDKIVQAEVKGLRAVADAANKKADQREKSKKVCC